MPAMQQPTSMCLSCSTTFRLCAHMCSRPTWPTAHISRDVDGCESARFFQGNKDFKCGQGCRLGFCTSKSTWWRWMGCESALKLMMSHSYDVLVAELVVTCRHDNTLRQQSSTISSSNRSKNVVRSRSMHVTRLPLLLLQLV